jgi:DUF438 domain-containing protein
LLELAALTKAGPKKKTEVSMREISDRLSRNVSIKEIWLVITDLESQKLVYTFTEKTGSKSITKVRWLQGGEFS